MDINVSMGTVKREESKVSSYWARRIERESRRTAKSKESSESKETRKHPCFNSQKKRESSANAKTKSNSRKGRGEQRPAWKPGTRPTESTRGGA